VEQLLNSELQWICNRISWLFVSQAFCLGAHAVLVTAQNVWLPVDFRILTWAMPVFGILTCGFVYVSKLAARKVFYLLADQRASLTVRINALVGTAIPRIGASRPLRDEGIWWTRRAGALSHHALPFVLAVIWTALLVARFYPSAPGHH
jgi:hypothetical protein